MSRLIPRLPLGLKRGMSYLLLAFGICFFHFGIFFGLDFSDSFYHLNQALHPANGIFLYPFLYSSIFIRQIVMVVGMEVINLRMINSFLLFLCFIAPFLVFKGPNKKRDISFILACSLILFSPFNVNILGYDTLSIVILSLAFIVATLYLIKRGLYLVLVLSLVSALAVLIRLPNILLIPILFLFLLLTQDREKRLHRYIPFLFLFSSLLITYIGYALYFRSFEDFLSASSNNGSHFILDLLGNYFRDGIIVTCLVFFILTGRYFFIHRKRFGQVARFLMGIVFLALLSIILIPTKYALNYSLFIFALVLSYTGVSFFNKQQSWEQRSILGLYLFFLFINPFGSNTGLLKGYSLLVLFPFVYSVSITRSGFWRCLFILMIPISLLTKVFNIYEDRSLFLLTAAPEHPLLNSIRTNEERAQYLNSVDEVLHDLKRKNFQVLFYGDKSHIFHYLYPDTSPNVASFFQPVDDLSYLTHLSSRIPPGQKTAIFLVPSYPAGKLFGTSPMAKALLQNGFEQRKYESVIFFTR